jgi:uncharacterized membrane protein YhaH (DUF805 family)
VLSELWFAVLAPPVVYLLDEELSYAFAYGACGTGRRGAFLLSTLICAAVVVIAGMMSLTQYRALPDSTDLEGARALDRDRFLAVLGMGTSVLFLLFILANFVPKLMLGICD